MSEEQAFEVERVDFPGVRVGLRTGGEDALPAFIAWRRENGLSPHVSATYNLVHGPERYDLCAAIERSVEPNAHGVVEGRIPAGRCAVLRNVSEPALGGAVHYLLAQWLPGSGELRRDAPLFFHRVRFGPGVPEHAWRNDVYLPLA